MRKHRILVALDNIGEVVDSQRKGHPEPEGRHADGRGLYLLVQKDDLRSWTQVVRFGGRSLDNGLGANPEESLKEARRVATNNQTLANGGFDQRYAEGDGLTFAKANDEYLRSSKIDWATTASIVAWHKRYVGFARGYRGLGGADSSPQINVQDSIKRCRG